MNLPGPCGANGPIATYHKHGKEEEPAIPASDQPAPNAEMLPRRKFASLILINVIQETVIGILSHPGSPGPPGACVSRLNQENQSTPLPFHPVARSTSPTEQEQEGLRVGELAFQQRKEIARDNVDKQQYPMERTV